MEGVALKAYANSAFRTHCSGAFSSASVATGASCAASRFSSSCATSRSSSSPGVVCSSSDTGINGEHHAAPLSSLPLLAAACILNAAAASASDAGTQNLISGLLSQEPSNALSLPTWTIHVASVVEWIVAMGLVWRFGDNPKHAAWKGLTWGMVPLLGGAMCACTWHFFYNAESLEILVALQAALTMLGNFTMWLAAYRIYRSSSKSI